MFHALQQKNVFKIYNDQILNDSSFILILNGKRLKNKKKTIFFCLSIGE